MSPLQKSFVFVFVSCLFYCRDKTRTFRQRRCAGIATGLQDRENTIKAQEPGWTDVWLVAWQNQKLIKTICSKKLQMGSIVGQRMPKVKTNFWPGFRLRGEVGWGTRIRFEESTVTTNHSNTNMFYCRSSAQIADGESKPLRDFDAAFCCLRRRVFLLPKQFPCGCASRAGTKQTLFETG